MPQIFPVSLPQRVNPRNVTQEANGEDAPPVSIPNTQIPIPEDPTTLAALNSLAEGSTVVNPSQGPVNFGTDAGPGTVQDVNRNANRNDILASALRQRGAPVDAISSFQADTAAINANYQEMGEQYLQEIVSGPGITSKWDAAREAKFAYENGVGNASLTAMTAAALAGRTVTDDPVGVIDFGRIAEITGLSDDQLTGVAVADQTTKISRELNFEFTKRVNDLELTQAQMDALQRSSFTEFALADTTVNEELAALQGQLVGYTINTGNEDFDEANNQFINVLRSIANTPMPTEDDAASAVAAAKYNYAYYVLWNTVGLGESGGGKKDPQLVIDQANQMLADGVFWPGGKAPEISQQNALSNAAQGFQDYRSNDPVEAVKQDAMTIIADAFGTSPDSKGGFTNAQKIDPAAWNSVAARELWSQAGGRVEVFVTPGVNEAIQEGAAAKAEQDATVAKQEAKKEQTAGDAAVQARGTQRDAVQAGVTQLFQANAPTGLDSEPDSDFALFNNAIQGTAEQRGGDPTALTDETIGLIGRLDNNETIYVKDGSSVRPATADELNIIKSQVDKIISLGGRTK